MANKQITTIQYAGTDYDICALSVDTSNITKGSYLQADGSGGIEWGQLENIVTKIGGKTGEIVLDGTLSITDTSAGPQLSCQGLNYTDGEPSSAYTGGGLKIAVIQSSDTSSITFKAG